MKHELSKNTGSANYLINQFPDASRRVRRAEVDHGPDNKEWGKKFWRDTVSVIVVCLGFAIAGVVLLVLLGALKFFGVKSLEP